VGICRVRIYDSAVLSVRNYRVRFCRGTIDINIDYKTSTLKPNWGHSNTKLFVIITRRRLACPERA
jgi:hypothetical protein